MIGYSTVYKTQSTKGHNLARISTKWHLTEKSPKTQEKDKGSNHVVPVMLTFYDTDHKTAKERSRSRVCINSKEHENVMNFRRHIITFVGIKEQTHSLGVLVFLFYCNN